MVRGGFALRNSCPRPPLLRCETQHLCKPNLLLLFSAQFTGQPKSQTLLNPAKAPQALLPFSSLLAKHHRELCWAVWLKVGMVHLLHVAAVWPCSDSTARAREGTEPARGSRGCKSIQRDFSMSVLLANSHPLIHGGNSPWEII